MERNGVVKDHRLMSSDEIMIIGDRNVVDDLLSFEHVYALNRVHENPFQHTRKIVKPPSKAIVRITREDKLLEFLKAEPLATPHIVLHELGVEPRSEEVCVDRH